jgi:hypothetical protein
VNSVSRNHPAKDLDAVLKRIGHHAGRLHAVYDLVPERREEIRQLFDEVAQVMPQVDAAAYAAQMRQCWRKK